MGEDQFTGDPRARRLGDLSHGSGRKPAQDPNAGSAAGLEPTQSHAATACGVGVITGRRRGENRRIAFSSAAMVRIAVSCTSVFVQMPLSEDMWAMARTAY